ncbi:MAG: DUF945 family protein [Burkholderiaceae bacterium]|nr:DUF945 family protein [Burkholderiaceae bacterium]
MKNKLLGALAALVILILGGYTGASWYVGGRIEAEANAAVDAINARLATSWPDHARVVQRRYIRGVFSSQANYALELTGLADRSTNPEMLFVSDIRHGPLPDLLQGGQWQGYLASIRTTLASTPFSEQSLRLAPNRAALDGTIRVQFDGTSALNWTLAPLELARGAVRLTLGGGQFKASLGPQLSWTRADLTLASLGVVTDKANIQFKGIRGFTDNRRGAVAVPIGKSGVTVENITLVLPDIPKIGLRQVESQFAINEEGPVVSGEFRHDVGSISVNDNNWGSLKSVIGFDRFGGDATLALVSLYHEMVLRSMSSAADSALVSQADIKQFWQIVGALLPNSPGIRIGPIVWRVPSGESRLEINAGLVRTALLPSGIGLTGNPLQSLELTLTISRPMIATLWTDLLQEGATSRSQARQRAEREVRGLIQMASKLNIGKLDGNTMISRLRFDGADFKLNGQTISAATLISAIGHVIPPGWYSDEPATVQDSPDEAAAMRHLAPSVIATILRETGYAFEETRDAQGDPLLVVAPGDSGASKLEISFVGCGDDATCDDILMRARFAATKPADAKAIADWNTRTRMARAYITREGTPALDADVNAYGGMGKDAAAELVASFLKAVAEFAKELNNPPQ